MATEYNTNLNISVNSNSYFEITKAVGTHAKTSSLLGRAIRLTPYQLHRKNLVLVGILMFQAR